MELTRKSDVSCPVVWLNRYLHMRGNAEGPLFIDSDGKPLTRDIMAGHIKLACEAVGLKDRGYNTHSFRIGKGTDMAMDGASILQIQQTGRWKSFSFLRYIRPKVIRV